MSVRNHYQELFTLIQPYLPTGWTKVVLYSEYGEASYSIEFFVRMPDGVYTKCFDIPGIDEEALLDTFDEMNEIYIDQRNDLPKTSIWTNCTITVESTGKMGADFDYTDLAEGSYEYKQAWKAKYLV